jgi:hypothetical protein
MEKHVSLIGILWIVWGALGVFGALIIWGLLFGLSFIPRMGPEAPSILRWVGIGMGLFIGILAVPKILAGVGLLRMSEWGRVLTLVLSFLSLLEVPLGTALAIYSMIILMKNETIQLFRKT